MIVSYLPEPHKHVLWNEIQRLLRAGTDPDANILDENELVWIAFEGNTLFAAGTIALKSDGAWLLAVGGYEHKRWLEAALDVAASWARDCGASSLRMCGRKGWSRIFRELGWRVRPSDDGRFFYERELNGQAKER